MDIYPGPDSLWVRDHGPYEIAEHTQAAGANVLVLLTAWPDTRSEPEERHDPRVLDFWVSRLRPLWAERMEEGDLLDTAENVVSGHDHATTVVIANRVGAEKGALLHITIVH
jgi:protein N-terminal amidase